LHNIADGMHKLFNYILTRSVPVYEYNIPRNPALASYFRTTLQISTHQSIVLESCWNPQNLQQIFLFAMKKIWFWVSGFLWVTFISGGS